MKRSLILSVIALLGSFIYIYHAQDTSLPTGGRLDAIYFENELHGFVRSCCSKVNDVYETSDGGKSWNRTSGLVKGMRRGRSFASPMIGWSVVEDSWPHSSIYGTRDGGKSWQLLFQSANKGNFYFDAIQAVSESEVWALGMDSYHTTDGGRDWEKVNDIGDISVDFLDHDHGWISGRQRTSDGGKTWEKLSPPPDPPNSKQDVGDPWDSYFIDGQHGWMISGDTENNIEGAEQRGVIWYTADGGNHWSCVSVLRHYLWSVFFLNEKVGWVAGLSGTFLKTTDGGKTWAKP